MLAAVCEALRLPYVAVRRDGEVTAAHGMEPMGPATTETVPLRYHGEDVGELVVGVRRGSAPSTTPTGPPWSCWPPRWPSPCTPRGCRRPCSARGSRSSAPARRSAAGCAATCTTASGPP